MTANILPFDDHSTIQAQAREWLIRLDRDEPPSASEIQQLRQWAAQSPAHRAEFDRISAFWSDANILTELSTPVYNRAGFSLANLWQPLWAKLKIGSPAFNGRGAIAASLCLAVAIVFFISPNASDSSNGIYASAIGELQERKLVDGSVIHINTDSQVQVDYSDQVRKIRLLRGEAHFQVAPDSDWPFEVYAGKGRVKAVGTAFSVRLNTATIDVTVSHGRVDLASSLEAPLQNSPTSAAPTNAPTQTAAQATAPRLQTIASLDIGQTASFKNTAISHSAATASQLDSIDRLPPEQLERRLAWRTGYLVFKGEPLAHVVAEINRYTPISIEIADPTLQTLRVGGRFKVGELSAMLEVLETGFGIQVSALDDQRIQLQAAD